MTDSHNPTGINSETSSYGFHCVIPDQDFARTVAHEVHSRLERVKSALASRATTPAKG